MIKHRRVTVNLVTTGLWFVAAIAYLATVDGCATHAVTAIDGDSDRVSSQPFPSREYRASRLVVSVSSAAPDSGGSLTQDSDSFVADGVDLIGLLAAVHDVSPLQVVGVAPRHNIHLRVEIQGRSAVSARAELLKTCLPISLGVVVHERIEQRQVVVLGPPQAAGSGTAGASPAASVEELVFDQMDSAGLALALSNRLGRVVVDESGIKGPRDFHASIPEPVRPDDDVPLRVRFGASHLPAFSALRSIRIVEVRRGLRNP